MTSNYRDAYWTLAQLVAHHTINGCNLRTLWAGGAAVPSATPSSQGAILWHLGRNHRTNRTSEIARQTPSGSAMSSSSAGTSACLYSTNG